MILTQFCNYICSSLTVIFLLIQNVRPEFYSSVHEMEKLVKHEGFLLNKMNKYIADNENKLQYLREKLEELERARDDALDEGADYFESPVNKYLLTKRLTIDRERIENMMAHNIGEKSLLQMDKYKSEHVFPDENELEGGIEGFLRIQYIYRLRTADMANGVLDGVSYSTELEAKHCFDIGNFALKDLKPKLGHSWFMEALNRYNNYSEFDDKGLNKSSILQKLADAKSLLGDFNGALAVYKEVLELNPNNEQIKDTYNKFLNESLSSKSSEIDYGDEHEPIPVNLFETDEFYRYRYTCSGHIKPDPADDRGLRCGYLTETHPFLLLAPIKVEELNHDPMLVVYYDVIYDSEIDTIKEMVNNKIKRATVMGVNSSVVSKVRTSQFVFFPVTHHKVLQAIDRRVEDMTNLNMIFAEDHQFANYGIGGHYAQHVDFFDFSVHKYEVASREMGNRIATVLFYLSDVEQGGGTAFPYLKRLCMPKKGSAVFWHNLYASGNGDWRTKHGACPIIVGSKWVQNRWVRETFQDDRRPCELYDDTL